MKLVNEIIQQAKHAFHEWKILSPIERRDSLLAISEIMLKNKASLVDAELSGGKTLSDSQTDVEMSAEIFRYFAGFCERIHGRTYSTHSRFTSYTIRQPIGVVGLITSYNYPLLLASWKTAPALASGNTVVLKPAHQTPESSLLLSKLLEPALPPNVFNVIPGDAAVGSQIVSHPLISKISFTGSYSTAKLISEKSLTRNVYELGGNNAAIICADTKDLEEAVETILSAAFGNGGQNCCACSKLFVEEEIYQQVLILVRERLRRFKIGDWRTMETEIGPVIDKVQYEKVANFIGEWHARGLNRMQAELPKGLPSDLYIPPTVFYDVEDAGFPAHEVFGPVLSIIKPFKSFRKVIDDVNNSGYGLVAGVFTSDISRMEYAVKNLEVGMVWVNTYNDTPTYLPFGGVKQSGSGKENGEEAIEEFTTVKAKPLTFEMSDLATISIHADANFHSADIAAPVSVSTTYRFPESWNNNAAIKAGYLSQQNDAPLEEVISGENGFNLYSRYTIDSRSRVEAVLGEIENGYAVTYSSGLAAVSALIFYVAPQRILISREGYHGTHGCIGIYQRSNPVISYVEDMKFPLTFSSLNDIDLIWLESPQNPRGEIYDLRLFASLKPPKSILVVDSTFSPPPLQYCLAAGVDVVMHSTTKFLGGHSDLLGGALIAKDKNVAEALKNDRIYLGSVMGNFEAWLLLRSLRTLNVRVRQQSETAARLVKWIIESKENDVFSIIKKVWHASVPAHPGYDVALREKWGYSAVFSIQFKSPHHARLIVRKLKYFANATSLGGCESLIEWRAAVDSKIDPGIVRISIGLEGFEALQNDLLQAFIQVKKIVDQEFPESSLNDASAGSQPEVKPEEKPKDVFEDIYSY